MISSWKKAAIGRYVTVFDTFSSAGEMHVHLVDIGQDIFGYGRALEAVTLEDVEERLEAFRRDRSVSVIVREESKE